MIILYLFYNYGGPTFYMEKEAAMFGKTIDRFRKIVLRM